MKKIFIVIGFIIPVFFNHTSAQTQADTLDVVNWNLEWFGDNAAELPQEMTRTRSIMNHLDADIYALVEIVNTDSLNSLVQSLNGNYSYIVSPFASLASSPNDPDYAGAQKLAFVYRNSAVRNVKGRALLQNSSSAYYDWASGRFPYMVYAEVLCADQNWRSFYFVIIHAKAYADYTSCSRRRSGAQEMKDTLDNEYANERLIILGDFNDDLDTTICNSFSESNYACFVKDSTDANSYRSVTLPLSQAGVSSINGYSSFLDHVIISNEVVPYYLNGSAEMLQNKVNSWVSNYTAYVSDHYPVRTRYVVDGALNIPQTKGPKTEMVLFPNPAKNFLDLRCETMNNATVIVTDLQGRKLLTTKHDESITRIPLDNLNPGTYFITLKNDLLSTTRTFVIIR